MPSATHPAETYPFIATFLLELPFDLRLPQGTTVWAFERTNEVELELFVPEEGCPEGLAVDTRLVCRTSRARSTRPIALDVFDDFWEGVGRGIDDPPDVRRELRRSFPVTVVAATTGTLRYDATTGEIREETLVDLFERTRRQLNEFLTTFGFVSGNPEIGAIRRTELASRIPVILDFHSPWESARRLELTSLALRSFETRAPPEEATTVFAMDLAYRDRLRTWPFRSVVHLFQRARRDLLSGDVEQTVIALVTATEILCEEIIAAVLTATGEGARVAGVLDCGLTNLVRDHISPLLERLGADPSASDDWLADCYQLRKRVVHEGFIPHELDAQHAMTLTYALAGALGTALRSDDRLATIGEQLPFGT